MTVSKRDKLLHSALVLFSANGVHNTSTASIAKHAGVATGTLFHHFENKLTLIEALYISIKQGLSQSAIITQEMLSMPMKQKANTLWNIAIDWAINHPTELIFCQQVASDNILPLQTRLKAMKQELSILEELITVGQSNNEIIDFPLDLMINQCQSQIITSGLFFISHPSYMSNSVYRQSAFGLFWRAIAINTHE
jgi:AcrR family transcriptional regulator